MTDIELQWLQRNTMALEAIRDILQSIRMQIMCDRPPNYQYDLSAWPNFNWDAIGATVTDRDRYGAAAIAWGGHTYIRRSPQNKFGEAIWFSRCTGKGENGENVYLRLITFKRISNSVEPIPDKTRHALHLTPGA